MTITSSNSMLPRRQSRFTGTLLSEAARLAGLRSASLAEVRAAAGGCAVQITWAVHAAAARCAYIRWMWRNGWACLPDVVEGDVTILVPPQEKIERRPDTTARGGCDRARRLFLLLLANPAAHRLEFNPPSMTTRPMTGAACS